VKPLKLGHLAIENPLMLAPMAGITDAPFRTVVESFGGVGLMFSEMIPSRSVSLPGIQALRKKTGATSAINAVQISGNDPYYMSEAAKINVELCSADIIDINLGCPVKKVVKGFAGSALMKDPGLARDIMRAVVSAVSVPITVKMRLGWDSNSINAPAIAKIAEEEGVRMVTVHARTRNQLYSGKADWSLVFGVKRSVAIPVIVNGDIKNIESLRQALEESWADGAMIARGACGRPWIFKQLLCELEGREFEKIDATKLGKTVLWHLALAVEHYGEEKSIPLFRKHLNFYSANMVGGAEFRNRINRLQRVEEIKEEIEKFFTPSSSG
jgi:tRNA-dihydrouridine synthase B